MQFRNGLIGQHSHARPFEKRRDPRTDTLQQSWPNHHIIGTPLQGHMHDLFHLHSSKTSGRDRNASSTRSTISSIEACPSEATVRSALA